MRDDLEAFVLWLERTAEDTGALRGRVEQVRSGRRESFDGVQELLDFLRGGEGPPDEDDGPGACG